MESLEKIFGERLLALRTAVKPKLTRERLAEIIGVDKMTIYRWENGLVRPDILTIRLLADYFKVNSGFLLGEERQSPDIQSLAEIISRQENELKELRLTRQPQTGISTSGEISAPKDNEFVELVSALKKIDPKQRNALIKSLIEITEGTTSKAKLVNLIDGLAEDNVSGVTMFVTSVIKTQTVQSPKVRRSSSG